MDRATLVLVLTHGGSAFLPIIHHFIGDINMMVLNYNSKKQLKENIGKSLNYTETSMFGNEYKSNGSFCGSNRPQIPEYGNSGREFFAEVTMRNDLILSVK